MITSYVKSDRANAKRKKGGVPCEWPSKRIFKCPHKITLIAGGTFKGEPYPPFVIYMACELEAEWTPNFFVGVNGNRVKARAFATPHGGQTEAPFRFWLEHIAKPSHPTLNEQQ